MLPLAISMMATSIYNYIFRFLGFSLFRLYFVVILFICSLHIYLDTKPQQKIITWCYFILLTLSIKSATKNNGLCFSVPFSLFPFCFSAFFLHRTCSSFIYADTFTENGNPLKPPLENNPFLLFDHLCSLWWFVFINGWRQFSLSHSYIKYIELVDRKFLSFPH